MANFSEKKPPSSPPSLFDKLEDKLVLRILCRVPRLSSYSSRYVCKRWLALINTSFYDKEYLRLRENYFNPFAILEGRRSEEDELEELLFGYDDSGNLVFQTSSFCLSFLPNFEEGKKIQVLAFNKQLLLCRIDSIYYICCPITKEWVSIPRAPHPRPLVQFGFIFDSFSRYTVLRVAVTHALSDDRLDIFSSTTGKWTPVDVWSRTDLNVVAYNGRVVWWTGDHPEGTILCDPYDVDPKNYSLIDKPKMNDNPYLARLGVCRGSLRACEIYRKDAPKAESLIVWKLQDQCGERKWTLEHNVSFKELGYNQKEEDYVIFSVLGFDPNDENILYLVRWESDRQDVISCNLCMKTIVVVESEYQELDTIWCKTFSTFG